MANWFYYDANRTKFGPMPPARLRQLALEGLIMPETIVENETGQQAYAKSINGLTFTAAPPTPVAALSPSLSLSGAPPAVPQPLPAQPASAANKTQAKTPAAYSTHFLKMIASLLSVCALLGAVIILFAVSRMANLPMITESVGPAFIVGGVIAALSWFIIFMAPAEIIKLLIHTNQTVFQLLQDQSGERPE